MASKLLRNSLSGTCRCLFALSAREVSSTASSLSADDLSSVHRGTAFENRAMMMLRYLSMSLTRIGGRSDGGIDLQGWWWLPAPPPTSHSIDPEQADLVTDNTGIHRRRIRVLAQCKAERKKLGPNYVREMEGVLYRHLHLLPSHEQDTKTLPTVALLVSESEFTKATVLCALSSPLPFFLLHLPRPSSETSKVAIEDDTNSTDGFASAIWNPALGGQKGILGGEIDLRWELSQDPTIPRRPSLWFHSTRLESWVPLSER
ncbi:hypothetical protein A7U60_g9168 [Sanghuangporus baumii]|uniref:Required for respiratory growth protein 7, mitochondrial n=1 Tax=Sanghuangporus baumii TaxID=108892 RepID=A0A9Q5N7S5_SANBA|nr:hypothetical protein A7U60_g9168 [Sanghuangporus baumii]